MRDFKKLIAWQKADDLVVQIYEVTKDFPAEERYGLTSQVRRAAVSVAANIAEGSGKQTLKEFQHFLYTARASLSEVEYFIHLGGRLTYLAPDRVAELETMRREIGRTLQGLINSVAKQIKSGRTEN